MSHAYSSDDTTRLFRSLAREVWIVTSASGPHRRGCTVTWLSPASIDPQHPVVLIGIAPNHATAETIDASGAFGAHLLHADQIPLAWRFAAASSRAADKFDGLEVRTGTTGSPLIANCLAWLEGRVFERFEMGDRIYYWADVVACEYFGSPENGLTALTDRTLFANLSASQRTTLIEQLGQDVALQAPRQAAWRARRRGDGASTQGPGGNEGTPIK